MAIPAAQGTAPKRRSREGIRLSGPIAVPGASGHVGRFLLPRLGSLSNEVRPLGPDDDYAAALEGAESIIHLAGSLKPGKGETYRGANLETVRRTLRELDPSTVKRIVFLSHVGANPASRNAYLRTKGEAEDLIREGGHEAVILRASLIYGPPEDPGPGVRPFISRRGRPAHMIGTGAQTCAPIYVEDAVDILVRAALDPNAPSGTFALVGPDELTMDEFVELVNDGQVTERHRQGRLSRLGSRFAARSTRTWVELLSRDSLPDSPRIAEALGLKPMSIGSAYGRLPILRY
jgi:uncharacterized protein YbjT (DUF2867 family)